MLRDDVARVDRNERRSMLCSWWPPGMMTGLSLGGGDEMGVDMAVWTGRW